MGDYFQHVVFPDVSAEDAPALAERLRQWLVERQIIEPAITNCSLGGPANAPGVGFGRALEKAGVEKPGEGMAIQVERRVYYTINGELTCRSCGARVEPEGEWMEAVDAWYAGDDAVKVACPRCGKPDRLIDWTGDEPWSFGHLALTVWNWPALSPRFIRELGEAFGQRVVRVRGKL